LGLELTPQLTAVRTALDQAPVKIGEVGVKNAFDRWWHSPLWKSVGLRKGSDGSTRHAQLMRNLQLWNTLLEQRTNGLVAGITTVPISLQSDLSTGLLTIQGRTRHSSRWWGIRRKRQVFQLGAQSTEQSFQRFA
jgi:hypothetical protein